MVKEPYLASRHGYRPDFRLGDTLVEVKADLHSFRNLRAALVQLAYYVSEETNDRGVLVLVNPRLTEAARTNFPSRRPEETGARGQA
jgi:hypothetical protein